MLAKIIEKEGLYIMKTGEKTKKALLDTACDIFAKNGFYKTTMRDITDASNTNVAAVNYHFGDKENLYFESFKHAAEVENREISAQIKDISDAKQLLKKSLYLRLEGIISKSPSSWLMRMFHHEIPNPTAIHEKIITEVMSKQRDRLKGMLAQFFEMDLSEGQLNVILSCLISPMLHQMRLEEHAGMHKKHFNMLPKRLDDDRRIEMIVCYIISGLEGLKKEMQNEKN